MKRNIYKASLQSKKLSPLLIKKTQFRGDYILDYITILQLFNQLLISFLWSQINSLGLGPVVHPFEKSQLSGRWHYKLKSSTPTYIIFSAIIMIFLEIIHTPILTNFAIWEKWTYSSHEFNAIIWPFHTQTSPSTKNCMPPTLHSLKVNRCSWLFEDFLLQA